MNGYENGEDNYVEEPESLGIQDTLFSSLKDAKPQIQRTVMDYGRDVAVGQLTGKGTPELIPNITAVTATGQELTVASARNRSWRTFVQGFGIDLGFALIAIFSMLTSMDFFDKGAWVALGILFLKTVIQTGVSYVARLKISPNYDKGLEALPDSELGQHLPASSVPVVRVEDHR